MRVMPSSAWIFFALEAWGCEKRIDDDKDQLLVLQSPIIVSSILSLSTQLRIDNGIFSKADLMQS